MIRNGLKSVVKRIPILGELARAINSRVASYSFVSSSQYWERRYGKGGTSGAGSYGRLARFKSEVLNEFVAKNGVKSVVEFGCGNGAQLSLAEYPSYLGIDVSPSAIELCRRQFADDTTKTFALAGDGNVGIYDMAFSLDVIFHLVEDEVFRRYMDTLFNSAERFVVIYSSNSDEQQPEPHVKHRVFTHWIETYRSDWHLSAKVPNRYPYDPKDSDQTSFADFYVYERVVESVGDRRQ